MLRPRRQYRILQAAFLFALIGVAFWGAYAGMYPHERNQRAERASRETNQTHDPQSLWSWLTETPESAGTIILCFITLGLVFVTGGLYVATARLARDSRDSSEKALDASTKTIKTMETNAELELRAYIGIVGGAIVMNAEKELSVVLFARNQGQTPAHKVQQFIAGEVRGSARTRPDHLKTFGATIGS